MRADRLLSILLLLQAHGRLTARELAARLEVSERTIHRDMEALSSAGVPVTADRGAAGGWRLLENYSARLDGFNLAEIQALALPGPRGVLSDLGLERAARDAFIKLEASLPFLNRRGAEYARQRILVDMTGWFPPEEKEDISALPLLQEALWKDRKVQMVYARADGSEVERLVDPQGLVMMDSTWYLVAAVEDQVRTYRVTRVRGTQVMEQPAGRPEGFDLAVYWEQWKAEYQAGMPRYPAVLRADPEQVPAMRAHWRFAHVESVELFDPPDPRGWVRVAVTFEVADEACRYVLGAGAGVEVLEPEELRVMVARAAEGVVEMYDALHP